MAKIKYSALVSEMRNKLNGSVLSKNRYGNYMRNKVTPVNPQTTYQTSSRQLLASLSQGWGGLLDAERAAWRAFSSNVPFTDIFGDQKYLDGKAMYIKCNANLTNVGEATIATPGIVTGFGPVTAGAITVNQTAGAMVAATAAFTTAMTSADFGMLLYTTPALKPSINFVKNQFRLISGLDVWASGTEDFLTEYNARYGTVSAGEKVWVRMAFVDLATGLSSVPVESVGIIGTV